MQARAGSAGQLLAMLRELALKGSREWTSTEVTLASGGSPATVRRHLNLLCQQGHLGREGLAGHPLSAAGRRSTRTRACTL